jgi:TATA-box binding protein (TBP) (component of TFIID and TFIIIB)
MEKLKESFANDYFNLIELSHEQKLINTEMSYISISTITMICDLSCSINTQALSDNFMSCDYPTCWLKKTKAHDEYELTKRGKTKKSFYNQVTINFCDHTKKSIKVFSNGRLQITGLTSVYDTEFTINTLLKVLSLSSNAVDKDVNINDVYVKHISIAMINSNFSFNFGVDIIKLKKKFEKMENVSIIYNPDVYPGLKVKHKTKYGVSSMFIFSTGNVVITGVKDLKEIEESFRLVTHLVNSDIMMYRTIFKVLKKDNNKTLTFKKGYPIHLYRSVS